MAAKVLQFRQPIVDDYTLFIDSIADYAIFVLIFQQKVLTLHHFFLTLKAKMAAELQIDRNLEIIVTKEKVTVLRDVSLTKMQNKRTILPAVLLLDITRGYARVQYDDTILLWEESNIACIMPGHAIEILECSEDITATAIVMSEDFLEDLKMNSFSHDYQKYHFSPVFTTTPEQSGAVEHIIYTIQTICDLQPYESPYRYELLISQMVIGYELLNICQRRQGIISQWTNRNAEIFNHFSELLAANFRTSREVNFYANLLYLSPKYFSNVIRQVTGFSAGHWIDEYVTAQAKRIMLTRSDITIQEISFRLGFPEPASFIHFFKRTTGITPKEFRNSKKA